MIKISRETENDLLEIETLLDLTFGFGRNTLTSYRLREGVDKIFELSFVLRDEFNVLVGTIRFWPILLGLQRAPGLLLGPLGVHPTRQGEGLGEFLIGKALKKASRLGWTRIILVGELEYYKRFGFSRSIVDKIAFKDGSNSNRLLGRELKIGSLSNLVGPINSFEN